MRILGQLSDSWGAGRMKRKAKPFGMWLRGVDLNHRPLGYEPNELPDCSTPRFDDNNRGRERQTRERNMRVIIAINHESLSREKRCGAKHLRSL
jgi:hypothetical protein